VSTKPTSSDVFHLYLREIGQTKLLSHEEEIELASRIQRGDEQAREQMINGNLRLVVKIARDYEGLGLPLLDLISEGNIGLMKGVERFDRRKRSFRPMRRGGLSSRSLAGNQTKTIRLPVHVVDKLAQIRKTEMRLRDLLEREPTDEEIAEELALTAPRVRQYKDASQTPLSLDAAIGTEDSGSVSETVADENAAAPFDRVVGNNDRDLLYEVLATLGERGSKILAMRFGLDDGKPKTLETLGEHFCVTRERIRASKKRRCRKCAGDSRGASGLPRCNGGGSGGNLATSAEMLRRSIGYCALRISRNRISPPKIIERHFPRRNVGCDFNDSKPKAIISTTKAKFKS
jgi:RNA polymerase primary sigma factor